MFDTRLATMDALDRRGAHEIRDKLPDFYNKRDRGGGLPLAFAMDKEVEIQHAKWWNSSLGEPWGASSSSPLDGEGVAVSYRAADRCGKSLGEEPSPS